MVTNEMKEVVSRSVIDSTTAEEKARTNYKQESVGNNVGQAAASLYYDRRRQ